MRTLGARRGGREGFQQWRGLRGLAARLVSAPVQAGRWNYTAQNPQRAAFPHPSLFLCIYERIGYVYRVWVTIKTQST